MASVTSIAPSPIAPSFESAGLGAQIVQNLYGLVSNIRDNANGYIAQAQAANVSIAQLSSIMSADAQEYQKRLNLVTSFKSGSPIPFGNACGAIGVSLADCTSLVTVLAVIASHTLGTSLTSYAQIEAEANLILANCPTFGRLW